MSFRVVEGANLEEGAVHIDYNGFVIDLSLGYKDSVCVTV